MIRTGNSVVIAITTGLILFTVFAGGIQLNDDGVWFDEWWSLYTAGADIFGPPLSPLDIWRRVSSEDPWQSPGYIWLLAAWGNTVGWSEATGRALSLLAGALLIAVTARLGGDLSGDPRVMIGSAAAAAGSGWLIFFTHELRTYTLYGLLTALLLLLYIRVQRRPSTARYLALGLTCTALLYTHYFAIISVGVLGLWHIGRAFVRRPDRQWLTILIVLIVSGLPLLAWLTNILTAAELTRQANRFDVSGLRVLTIAGDAITAFSSSAVGLFFFLILVGLDKRQRGWWITIALTVCIGVIALIVYRVLAVGETRYLFSLHSLLALITGYGFAGLAVRPFLFYAAIALWLITGFMNEPKSEYRKVVQRTPVLPLQEMAQMLVGYTDVNDATVLHLGDAITSGIQGHPFAHYFTDLPGRDSIIEMETTANLTQYAERVRAAVGAAQRVWTLFDPRWPSSHRALYEDILARMDIVPCLMHVDEPDMRITGSGRIPRTGAVFTTPDGVGSIMVAPVDRLHRRGDQLDVWLGFWQTNIPPETYSFSLRAVDADGAVLAAVDRGVPPASETGLDRPTCRAVTLAVPPSAERIEIIIYDWRTLEPLRGSPSRIAALQAPSSNSGMSSARADDPDRMKNGQNL